MKKYFLFACVAAALVSCSSDEFLGNEAGLTPNETGAILFQSTNMKASRADKVGSEAAALLGNNFVVEGVKGDGSSYTEVFDHYNVNYKANTANSTESNSSDWEYVGQTKHDLSAVGAQTIKYWDFSADQYDFVAFSYGTSSSTDLTLSEIDYNNLGTAVVDDTPVYTVDGSVADLTKAYAADLVTVKKADYTTSIVTPRFRRMGAKVRIGMYETVPGYSVKGVVFYEDDTRDHVASTPTLYASSAVLPSGDGTMKVFYPTINSTSNTDNNKAHVVFTGNASTDVSSTLAFASDLAYSGVDADENTTLHGSKYLGRHSNEATYATADTPANAYEFVLPYGEGNDLKLHVDYTLVPIDGGEETITVSNATAIVPAVYTAWEPNYAYTYLFKISMNTNGVTGDPDDPDEVKGLYPITFDAVVMNDMEDGILETVTTVADPSITTYAKGVRPTDASEYKVGDNIYVAVKNGTVAVGNVALYTATIDADALQSINEVTVANALVNGTQSGSTWTLTDAAGKKLTVTSATAPSIVTAIPAADSYTGNAITGNFAKFTPAAAGTYVFEYTSAAVNYADKDEYNAAKGTNLDESEFAALSAADKVKTPAVKAYKVIIVHA